MSDVDRKLFEAVRRGDVIEVAECLNNGADVLARNFMDDTVLHKAVICENEEVVKLVLDEIKKVVSDVSQYINTAKNDYGQNPLTNAVKHGRLNAIQMLLDCGIDTEVKTDVLARDYSGVTILHEAVDGKNEEVVKLVLDEIKKIVSDVSQYINTAKDDIGRTPLMFAAANGHLNATQMLLDCGIDTEVKTTDDLTALHYAYNGLQFDSDGNRNHKEVIELLIAKGADVNAKNKSGKKPCDIGSNIGVSLCAVQ